METIPFTMATQKNQIPRSKLNKGCEWSLQRELQTPEERGRGKLQKVKSLPCSWTGRINIVKITILSKAIIYSIWPQSIKTKPQQQKQQ
jgi:hypothetical protein